jgi:hypothetical protein
MNTEVFVAVLAALVAYRVLSPLIDLVNPLSFLKQPKGTQAIQGNLAARRSGPVAVSKPAE